MKIGDQRALPAKGGNLQCGHGAIDFMRHRGHDHIILPAQGIRAEGQAVLMRRRRGIDQGVVDGDLMTEPFQPPDHVDDLGIANIGNVGLEGEPEHQDAAGAAVPAGMNGVSDPSAHAVVDRSAGKNNPRQMAEALRAMAEIVRID